MNGIFDLGGTDGLGRINPSSRERVFKAEWEKVAFAFFPACFRAGFFNVDEFRHAIERMDPTIYLNSAYYEFWLHAVEHHGIARGEIDPVELDRRTQHYLRNPEAPLPAHEPQPELLDFVNTVVFEGASMQQSTDKPIRFQVGDVVRVVNAAPLGHTRLARYIRGKDAKVIAYRGSYVFPDVSASDGVEDPHHVYTIHFDGAELWGEQFAEPNTSVTFDVWDPYIAYAEGKAEVTV